MRKWTSALLLVILVFELIPKAFPQPNLETLIVASGDTLTIGYWLVVAGPDKALGVDSQRGIEVAISDRGGNILDHPIRLVGEDSSCTAGGGVTAATRLAANARIVAAGGSSCSGGAG